MNWYIHCIKNYAIFSGRARRKEYWMFILFNIIFIGLIAFIASFISDTTGSDIAFSLLGIYILFIIIPYLAVTVRRLHDINKSGTYWFVRFIPFIGGIWLFILLVENSWDGPNKWGRNPKNIGNNDNIDQIGTE